MIPRQLRTSKPFLWGPVKSALIQDAKTNGPDTILRLCYTDEQRVKEMMVAVLTDLGRDDLALVDGILHRFFPQEKEAGKLKKAWRLLHKTEESSDLGEQSARKIGVEVAGNLGIRWVLEAAGLHADPVVRTAAVRYTYHLWKRERATGFAVLDHIASKVMSGLVPDLPAIETTMGLSMIIFFDHTHDKEALKRLREVWHRVIDAIFILQADGSRVGDAVRGALRERIMSFAIRSLLGTLEEMPPGYTVRTYAVERLYATSRLAKPLR